MARKHYHVLIGMAGYMPNSNDVYTTRESAERGAAWWARTFRDDGDHVIGSARCGLYEVSTGERIEIATCDQAGCLEGDHE